MSDLNLSAFEFSLTNTANALIIERTPAPELILGAQDRQSLFGFEMNIHFAETLWSIAKNLTIGTAADCVVGQNPISTRGRRCGRDILYNEKNEKPSENLRRRNGMAANMIQRP